ncbi:MAG: DNA translocase FtsK 4TM domain-containing protein [Anaerolineaceae bacterium]
MPRPSSRSSSSRSSRSGTSNKRSSSKKSSSRKQIQRLSPEVKKDFIGVLLAAVGVVSLLGFFTGETGLVSSWFSHLLKLLAGWGGVALPIVILACGLWLLFRNVQKFPRLSTERGLGVSLLFLNMITWFHLSLGGGYATASQGKGGGYVGAFFTQLLTTGLGQAGTVVFLIAWVLIAILLVVDLSLPDLAKKISAAFAKPNVQKSAVKQMDFQPVRQPVKQTIWNEPRDLPEGFNPLNLQEDNDRPTGAINQRRGNSETNYRPAKPSIVVTPKKAFDEPVMPIPVKPSKPWPMPSIDAILDPATPVIIQGHVDKDRARIIEETLASFSAPGHVVEIHRGPTITQFGVEPDFIETRNGRMRVRVAKIVALTDDLALALAASSIRIEAPVPGRSFVGLEVPNAEIAVVGLREVIESESYRKLKSSLRLALGKDVAGKPICADLTTMPHLLIAGTTNSGKSVCVNSILCSLLLNNSPQEMRLLLVDPKRVELTGYNHIPHLLAPVVVEADKVVGALQWVIREMDARYHKFAKAGVRNILEFNRRNEENLPFLVVVIDELADLMMLAPDDTERCITRLAQLARATGIHLIIATQRPSVDVVTGLIKANMPARIAFMVASNTDSRVILDQPGAEKLLGRGDMLYQAPDSPAPVRLQGTYVSDSEIQRLVENWRTIAMNYTVGEAPDVFANASYEMEPGGTPLKQGAFWDEGGNSDDDHMLNDAIAVVRREGKASISMLQRRLKVGYARAARMIDTLEDRGIVGPQTATSQVREVLDYGETEDEKTETEETEAEE